MTASDVITWALLAAVAIAAIWLAVTELRPLADEDDEALSR